MRVLHLSDTHLHAPESTTHHPEIDAAGRLDTVVAAAGDAGPVDAIALTGDICDDGSRVGAQAVHDRLTAAYPNVPIVAVPGNHDRTAVVTSVFGMPPARLGAWRVVTAATNSWGRIEGSAKPVVAALDAVGAVPTEPLLLLMHHPLRSRSTHEWFVLRHGPALADRLAALAGPVVILSGHTHEAFVAHEGSVWHVGAPSTYYAISHDGPNWTFAPHGAGAQVLDLDPAGGVTITPIRA
mgnify:CR=1 FL=1